MVLAARENKPYILVGRDRFELNCNGWTLFLALKALFNQIQKVQPNFYGLLCKKLIDCKAFDPAADGQKEVNKLYKNPQTKA